MSDDSSIKETAAQRVERIKREKPSWSIMDDTVARISDTYARGSIDVTNRQNFQLHWLRIEDVPTVWDELARVGWTSQGACGDVVRTVTGCPLAGVDHEEL